VNRAPHGREKSRRRSHDAKGNEQIGQDDIGPNRATKYGDTNDNVNGKGRVGTSASLHAFPTSSRNDRYLRSPDGWSRR
jgi:hypothetical protein